jgi:hypothetical protein
LRALAVEAAGRRTLPYDAAFEAEKPFTIEKP